MAATADQRRDPNRPQRPFGHDHPAAPIDTTWPAQPRADRVVVSTAPGRTGT